VAQCRAKQDKRSDNQLEPELVPELDDDEEDAGFALFPEALEADELSADLLSEEEVWLDLVSASAAFL
jgi:hypothetical protein